MTDGEGTTATALWLPSRELAVELSGCRQAPVPHMLGLPVVSIMPTARLQCQSGVAHDASGHFTRGPTGSGRPSPGGVHLPACLGLCCWNTDAGLRYPSRRASLNMSSRRATAYREHRPVLPPTSHHLPCLWPPVKARNFSHGAKHATRSIKVVPQYSLRGRLFTHASVQ